MERAINKIIEVTKCFGTAKPPISLWIALSVGNGSSRSLRPSVQMTRDQLLPTGEHDLQDTPEWPAVLDWLQSDGNFISRLEGLLAKACGGYASRGLSLQNPMYR